MSQEKTDKKDVKVEDLAPKKDAKGGIARSQNVFNPNQNAANQDGVSQNLNSASLNSANQNSSQSSSNLD